MKLKAPQTALCTVVIEDQAVSLTRDDGRCHYKNCVITLDDTVRELDEMIFTGCQFEGDFSAVHVTDTVFEKCRLMTMMFEHISFRRVSFRHCQMTGFSCDDVGMKDVSFESSKMNLLNLVNSTFDGVSFVDNDMTDSYFFHIKPQKWTVQSCRFTSAAFIETPLTGLNLSDSDLEGITVQADDLVGVTVNRYQAADIISLFGIEVID